MVFENGGSPKAEVDFGTIYYGQFSEIMAFLVNNGPKLVKYISYFHPNKTVKEVNFNESSFAVTPWEAGNELTKRSLAFTPANDSIEPFHQLAVKFSAFIKPQEKTKGWRNIYSYDSNLAQESIGVVPNKKTGNISNNASGNVSNVNSNNIFEEDKPDLYYSTLIVKFDVMENDLNSTSHLSLLLDNKKKPNYISGETNNEQGKITNNVIVFMRGKFISPKLTFSKTQINFGECKINDEKTYTLVIKNLKPDMPLDFNFKKTSYFSTSPNKGILDDEIEIEIKFKPEKLGTVSSFIEMKYVNDNYSFPISVIGQCREINNKNKKFNIRSLELVGENHTKNLPEEITDDVADNFDANYISNLRKIAKIKEKEVEENEEEYKNSSRNYIINVNNNSHNNHISNNNNNTKKNYNNNHNKFFSIFNKHDNDVSSITSINNNSYIGNTNNKNNFLSQNLVVNNELKNNKNQPNFFSSIQKPIDLGQYCKSDLSKKIFNDLKLSQQSKPIQEDFLNKANVWESINEFKKNQDKNIRLSIPFSKDLILFSKDKILNSKASITSKVEKANKDNNDDESNSSINEENNNAEKKEKRNNDFSNNINNLLIEKLDKMTSQVNSCQPEPLKLKPTKETLWVIKPIGKYEPSQENKKLYYRAEDFSETKKPTYLSSHYEPNSLAEQKECEIELNGEDLMKIDVKSKEFEFGEMFKNSTESKTLWISNSLKTSIIVEIDTEIEALSQSYPKSLVIPPGVSDGFVIVVSSKIEQKINFFMKYTINYSQSFRLKINANIINPFLRISKPISKFDFKKEKQDFPSLTSTQTLELENTGNDVVSYSIRKMINDCFDISPMEGEVDINSRLELNISFISRLAEAGFEYNEEVEISIKHGETMIYKISALLPKSLLRINPNEINMGSVHIGIAKSVEFYIENVNKNLTVFEFENNSSYFRFAESKGYIREKRVLITCTIESNEENPEFNDIARLFVRGGPTIELKVLAKIIVPNVTIIQPEFNFGFASFGEKETLPLTFSNNSELTARVIIDFRTGFNKNFAIKLSKNNKNVNIDNIITNLEILEKQDEEIFDDETHIKPKDEEKGMEEEEEEDQLLTDLRFFEVEIAKNSLLEFDFTFSPTEAIATSEYYTSHFNASEIFTNFELKGNTDSAHNHLSKPIKAKIVKSTIKLVPEYLEFEKTFIYSDQENFSRLELKIYNKGIQETKWRIDDDNLDSSFKCLKKEGIFPAILREEINSKNNTNTITASPDVKSTLDSNAKVVTANIVNENFASVYFTFTPSEAKEIESHFIILIEQDGQFVPCKKVSIKATGSFPRIFFDRSDILMPIVPLGIESITRFKIKNEGFDHITLNAKVLCDAGFVPLEVRWLDTNSIGIIKKECTLELSFKTTKPLSFTAKLIFVDTTGYYETFIFVHGTSENCSFTNFFFIERYFHKLDIITDVNTINLEVSDNSTDVFGLDAGDDRKSMMTYSANSSYNTRISLMNLNSAYLHKLNKDCEYILEFIRYVNCTSTITSFPGEICSIKNNAEILYEFIFNLSNKMPPGKLPKNEDTSKRAFGLKQQFISVITYLQSQGAYLNTVLPDYLLDFNNFKKVVRYNEHYIKVLPFVWEKRLQRIHKFVFLESWVMLFYQIIKVYYLSRVNLKNVLSCLSDVNENSIYSNFTGITKGRSLFDYLEKDKEKDKLTISKKNTSVPMLKNVVNNENNGANKKVTIKKSVKNLVEVEKINSNKNKNTNKDKNRSASKESSKPNKKNKNKVKEVVDPLFSKLSHVDFKSNVYSKEEFLLLKMFQTYHNSLYTHNHIELTNFSEDFKDYHVLYSVFMHHFQFLEENLKGNRKKAANTVDLKYNVTTEKIVAILKEYGLFTHMNYEYLSFPQHKEMLVFLLVIFQNLKHFVPKDVIVFTGILSDKIIKSIVINNTTNKPLEYVVKIEGQEDYALESNNDIKIEPNTEVEVLISYKSKTSKERKGKLYLINRLEGMLYQAAPLCYNLKSNITGRRSEGDKLFIQSMMYESHSFKFPIKNKFKEKGEFEITLEIFKKVLVPKKIEKKEKNPLFESKNKSKEKSPLVTGLNNNNSNNNIIEKEYTLVESEYPFIYLDSDDEKLSLKLEAEQTKEIDLTFLPINLNTYVCNIVLFNEQVGEFQYTIEAQGLLPKISKRLEYEAILDDFKDLLIPLPYNNSRLEASIETLNKVKENLKELKENQYNSSTVIPIVKTNTIYKPTKRRGTMISGNPLEDKKSFTLESTKPYLIVDPRFDIINNSTFIIDSPNDVVLTEKKINEMNNIIINMGSENYNNAQINQSSQNNLNTLSNTKRDLLKSKKSDRLDTIGSNNFDSSNSNLNNNNNSNNTSIKLLKLKAPSTNDKPNSNLMTKNISNNDNSNNSFAATTRNLDNKTSNQNSSPDKKQTKKNLSLKIFKEVDEKNTDSMTIPGDYVSAKFQGRNIITYEADVIVKNSENIFDIRIFKVAVLVKPKIIKAKMELNCPFGQRIEQAIPIINSSHKEWALKAELNNLDQKAPFAFSIESEKKVDKHTEGFFTLKFEPLSRTIVKSILSIENLNTKETYEYELTGLVEDPLAEGNIEIECSVGKTETYTIKLTNPSAKEAQYRIETDLWDVISGPLTLHMKPKSDYDYKLIIKPIVGRVYFGKITFLNIRDGNFKWYTIKVKSKSTFNTLPINLSAVIRTTVKAEVEITNPLKRDVYFNVEFKGDFLKGDNEILVASQRTSIYKLYFSPLDIIDKEGELHIYNEAIGEYVYKLRLYSQDQAENLIETVKCEIGKSADVSIKLENPSSEDVQIFFQFYELSVFKKYPQLQSFSFSCERESKNKKNKDNNKESGPNTNRKEKSYKFKFDFKSNNFSNKTLSEVTYDNKKKKKNSILNEIGEIDLSRYNPYKETLNIIPNMIVIPKESEIEVTLRYFASTLDNIEEAMLVFSSNKKIGDWKYHFKGQGVLPSQMPKTSISTYLGGIVSGNILFKNPFEESLIINVDIQHLEDYQTQNFRVNNNNQSFSFNDQSTQNASDMIENNIFKIMLKQTRFELEAFKSIVIPFSFSPTRLIKYKAMLKIEASQLVKWNFPIEGVTEIKSNKIDFTVNTKSKLVHETAIDLDLFDYDEKGEFVKERFNIILQAKNPELQELIDKSCSIEFDEMKLNNIKMGLFTPKEKKGVKGNYNDVDINANENKSNLRQLNTRNDHSGYNNITTINNNEVSFNNANTSMNKIDIFNNNNNNNSSILSTNNHENTGNNNNKVRFNNDDITAIINRNKMIIDNTKNLAIQETNVKTLPVLIKFFPLKPFKAHCELLIIKKTGAQWVFNCLFESHQGIPEDIIRIESQLHKTSYIHFPLNNIFTKRLKFKAYLSHDTSSELSVSPTEGLLDQVGKDGVEFTISFTPNEYGKARKGLLIIDTEDIQWVFEVVASFFEYKKPVPNHSSIFKNTESLNIRQNIVLNERKNYMNSLNNISGISNNEGNRNNRSQNN